MTSRLRGPSLKEPSKGISFSKDHFHADSDVHPANLKNGVHENRYHFGMIQPERRQDRNGHRGFSEEPKDSDFLYGRSKQDFGTWDIRDVVRNKDQRRDDRSEIATFQDHQLTNGRHQVSADVLKQSKVIDTRDEGYAGSLRRETRKKDEDRENGGDTHKSLGKRDSWQSDLVQAKPRSKPLKILKDHERENQNQNLNLDNDRNQDQEGIDDERDTLPCETKTYRIDSRSPDRRIRAMIERFKSREEGKMKSRKNVSPEKEKEKEKLKEIPRNGDNGDDRGCEGRVEHVDRILSCEQPEVPESRHRRKSQEAEKPENDVGSRTERKSRIEKHEVDKEQKEEYRKGDVSRKSDRRSQRRKSREVDEEHLLPVRDSSSKRRSYTYEGSPENFDVRIQRYERALPGPRRDPELHAASSPRDHRDVSRERDRDAATRKSSFKSSSASRRDSFKNREPGATARKTLFKVNDSDFGEKTFLRSPEARAEKRDLAKAPFYQDDESLGNPYRSQAEIGRVSFKENSEVSRKSGSFKDPGDTEEPGSGGDGGGGGGVGGGEVARKHSFRNHADGPVTRVSFKIGNGEAYGRNSSSSKEQTGESGKVSFKDDHATKGNSAKDVHPEYGSSRKSADEEVHRVSLTRAAEKAGRGGSPLKDRGESKKQVSSRGKGRDEWKSERHSRPLTPPYENISSYSSNSQNGNNNHHNSNNDNHDKSWHESNKLFASKYLRENSKVNRENSPVKSRETTLPVDPEDHHRYQDLETRRTNSSRVSIGKDEVVPKVCTSERNGSTIIRIRASPVDESAERRRRRRPAQELAVVRVAAEADDDPDETEEQERRDRRISTGPNTPSRRLWNYREGGVLITDVEDGQPCLQCGETCPGFSAHTWRKNCTSCKCPRDAHDVCHEEWVSVRSRLGLKGDEPNGSVGSDPRERGLAWAPPGLPSHKVEKYFSLLPENLVPRLGTDGERYRDRQLTYQLPKQDLARKYCRHLDPKHATSADDFMAARNEIALDIGTVQEAPDRDQKCGSCHETLDCGSFVVSASKLGFMYHPACFRCTKCQELLVDLAYCVHDDLLYCERHYAEQLKPRCAACDELIFSGEYTKAMNKEWHSGHFCCWQCDESLTGQRYVLRDEHPYCIKCYESVFANGCEECNKIIGIDSKDLSYKDKHWHEACFLCNRCRVSLVDKQFGSKVDKIYCGNCYDAQFASRCDGCGEIFRAGTKKMEYKTRQWHEKCFCCVVCKNPFGTNSFIPREQEIYCTGCYEDKFATRCVKCNQVITSNGVTYKNAPWHKDCFTCVNCNQSLAGKRFTSRDDKPYCADCFGELFAKRCTSCSKPITGIGGTRFISFQDRHWHNDCFICAGCKTSLVGRGFITDGDDIICPECAKQKLM